mgnify:CR=1 FL=1|tara:strand:+ start:875 stop:1378 length:504 start_codon:yes stop_codon:yes gene_type:complete
MSTKQDAVDILNEFIADICIAVEVLRDYELGVYPNRDELFRQGMYRLCLQSIFLNCAKYTEFCREYGQVLRECCPDLQDLNNRVKSELEKRGVNAFRSKYIAHNRCDITKKPFTLDEINSYVVKILGGSNAKPFLDFLMPESPDSVPDADYFTGFLGVIRDRICAKL